MMLGWEMGVESYAVWNKFPGHSDTFWPHLYYYFTSTKNHGGKLEKKKARETLFTVLFIYLFIYIMFFIVYKWEPNPKQNKIHNDPWCTCNQIKGILFNLGLTICNLLLPLSSIASSDLLGWTLKGFLGLLICHLIKVGFITQEDNKKIWIQSPLYLKFFPTNACLSFFLMSDNLKWIL